MYQTSFTRIEGFGPLLRMLEAAGSHSLERVFRAEDIPLDLAFAQNEWIPSHSLMGLLERSARETGDELIGLRLGALMRPEDFGLWARYAVSAPDLRGMIERANRTFSYFESVNEFALDVTADLARWSYKVNGRTNIGRRHNSDRSLWPRLTGLRYYLGADWTPSRIECDYERPLHWRKLEEQFGAPIVFSSPANSIVFHKHLLDRPSIRKSVFAARITFSDLRRLAVGKAPRTSLEAAREVLRMRISEARLDIEGTAALLGTSRRTLQRKLSEGGLTFRDLLEQVRMERALALLVDSSASITEIAFEVGYDDATSFSRAFRRWNGCPPKSVRRTLRSRPPLRPLRGRLGERPPSCSNEQRGEFF